ncbi:MAG TPA: hypothetical protein VH575_23250 [Gemmataceae bacterium]|jgi:hypothetical protein
MHEARRRIRFQARPTLVWTLLFFLAGHLILGVYLVHCHLELCDPEFHQGRSLAKTLLLDDPSCSASAHPRQSAEARAAH